MLVRCISLSIFNIIINLVMISIVYFLNKNVRSVNEYSKIMLHILEKNKQSQVSSNLKVEK